jgi:hypothetical protein
MDRRAVMTFDMILTSFYRFFILFLVALAITFFTVHFMKMRLEVFRVESEIFVQGLLNSPSGISYKDGARVYPGVIDLQAFRTGLEQRLADGFHYEDKRPIAARIELKGAATAAPVYYNKEMFDVWYALGKTKVPGLGSAQVLERTYPVIVKDGARTDQAMLKIIIAIPNS